jgi:hypothetical protein
VQLPGAGSDAVPQVALQQNAFTSLLQASDAGDTLAIGVTADLLNGDFFIPGQLFVVTFNTCGPAPTAADFACVVQGASDTNGLAAPERRQLQRDGAVRLERSNSQLIRRPGRLQRGAAPVSQQAEGDSA